MANSFLIVMSIWFGINILFVVVRLWVTRADRWRNCDNGAGQLSAVCVKSRRPCQPCELRFTQPEALVLNLILAPRWLGFGSSFLNR
jgi:hypothetical protein